MGLNALADGQCSDIGMETYLMERGEIMVEVNDGLVDLIIIDDDRSIIPLIRW